MFFDQQHRAQNAQFAASCLDSLFTRHTRLASSPVCSPVTPDSLFICKTVHLSYRIACSSVKQFTCHTGQVCSPVTSDRAFHLPHRTELFTCHTVHLSHRTCLFTCHTGNAQGRSPATPDRTVYRTWSFTCHTGHGCSPVTPFTCQIGQACSAVTPFTCHIGQACSPVTLDRLVHLSHRTGSFTCHTGYSCSHVISDRAVCLSHRSPVTTDRDVHLSQWKSLFTWHTGQTCSPGTPGRLVEGHTLQDSLCC